MSHPLESIIGYTFKNPELLETALTHTSYANETRPPPFEKKSVNLH